MLLPYMEPGRIEAGCDEAGRGCLAGAVFAAAERNVNAIDAEVFHEFADCLLRDGDFLIERERL